MECFLKKVFENKGNEDSHRYFIRFGRGNYNRRFLLSFNKSKKIKIKASFELANDLVNFVNEIADVKFNGKIMTTKRIEGSSGINSRRETGGVPKKKGSSFVYEDKDMSLKDYPNAYCYLLDAETEGVKLKIKKALPKPGKDAEKIDDAFCVLELDLKYWDKVKDLFFWDVPDGKKCTIEHNLIFEDIEIPKNEKDPVKMRENAVRIGKIIRRIDIDGNKSEKEYKVRA